MMRVITMQQFQAQTFELQCKFALASLAMQLQWWTKCFAILAMAMQAHGMFSKRPLPEDRLNLPKEKRLRSNIGDLYLSNDVSGQRTQTLMDDAHDADVQGFRRLVATPSASSTGKN